MKVHALYREQRIDAPLDRVFPFFSKPENLEKLTPEKLGFKVLTPRPIPMHVGSIIDYVVTLRGIPMRWTSCIAEYDPPHRFVDVQLKGPYSLWHHAHTFEEIGGSTVVRDEVNYALPGGPFGELAHVLMVRRQLDAIFEFRRSYLESVTQWGSAVGTSAGSLS